MTKEKAVKIVLAIEKMIYLQEKWGKEYFDEIDKLVHLLTDEEEPKETKKSKKCDVGCVQHKYHCAQCWRVLGYSPANNSSRPFDIPNLCDCENPNAKVYKTKPQPHSKNSDLLADFTKYCEAHPGERFWQALKNWSGAYNILYLRPWMEDAYNDCTEDTYEWETKDGK